MFTAFNQSGRALVTAATIEQIIDILKDGGFKFYFILNENNVLAHNAMQGRVLPKRTSRGMIKEN